MCLSNSYVVQVIKSVKMYDNWRPLFLTVLTWSDVSLKTLSLFFLKFRVILTPRQNLSRIILKGIFQGVKVVRGPDWDWGNQDGEANLSYSQFQGIFWAQ